MVYGSVTKTNSSSHYKVFSWYKNTVTQILTPSQKHAQFHKQAQLVSANQTHFLEKKIHKQTQTTDFFLWIADVMKCIQMLCHRLYPLRLKWALTANMENWVSQPLKINELMVNSVAFPKSINPSRFFCGSF